LGAIFTQYARVRARGEQANVNIPGGSLRVLRAAFMGFAGRGLASQILDHARHEDVNPVCPENLALAPQHLFSQGAVITPVVALP
jgi:hypothetical protein